MYKLRFAGGDIMTFPAKCIGFLIKLPDNVKEFTAALPVQPWSNKGGSLTMQSDRVAILGRIEHLLQSRHGNVCIFCFVSLLSNYLSNVQTWNIFRSGLRSLTKWLQESKVISSRRVYPAEAY